jgi:uncharacterized protein (TIGR02118 family)
MLPVMLKIILCLKRKPEMTRAEFHRYWKEDHAKVVREVAGPLGMRRNVHNRTFSTALDARIREGRGADPSDYDGVAESWFDSLDALVRAVSTDAGRAAARRLAQDEARFIDFSGTRMFFVEEECIVG